MSRLAKKLALPLSRRAVLRGAGCTVALPFLESLHALADVPSPGDFPKRFGIVFLGCGINEDHWSAEGQGAAMKLSKTLSPLEPLKEKINVIDGLYVQALTGQGIHPGQTGSLLSGAHISKGAIIHSGISVDQMIANRIGEDTPQSSILLNISILDRVKDRAQSFTTKLSTTDKNKLDEYLTSVREVEKRVEGMRK